MNKDKQGFLSAFVLENFFYVHQARLTFISVHRWLNFGSSKHFLKEDPQMKDEPQKKPKLKCKILAKSSKKCS
jgi:hypothetical protein